jgi:hypothetical protein
VRVTGGSRPWRRRRPRSARALPSPWPCGSGRVPTLDRAGTAGSYRSRPSSPAGLTMCADPTKPGDPTNPARKQARPGQRAPSRRHDEPFRLTRSMTRLPSLLGFRTFRLAINCTQFDMVGVRSRPQMHSDRPALRGARRSAHTSDAMHNGGSRVTSPASDHHVGRLAFQNMSDPNDACADSGLPTRNCAHNEGYSGFELLRGV